MLYNLGDSPFLAIRQERSLFAGQGFNSLDKVLADLVIVGVNVCDCLITHDITWLVLKPEALKSTDANVESWLRCQLHSSSA